MKFSTRASLPLVVLSALIAVSNADDVLYSRRMAKRGIDANGNYNICKQQG